MGAKRDRPLFQQALARCEAGETGGIIVARLDGFARSAVDALESIKCLNEAGARELYTSVACTHTIRSGSQAEYRVPAGKGPS